MKVVITVTAVCDLPDDVGFEEVCDADGSLGEHIVLGGHKLQPIVDFLEYKGLEDGEHAWDVPDDETRDEIDSIIETEEYTMIPVDGFEDND